MPRTLIAFLLIYTAAAGLYAQRGGFGDFPEAAFMDVHGAGAQRSDPKSGDPADYPRGYGPQGDVIRIYNYVRPVRGSSSRERSYPLVDTGQKDCFDDRRSIDPPAPGKDYYGQDAQQQGLAPSYTDNGDGTVTDNNTGLMWRLDPGDKVTYAEAVRGARSFKLAGHTDWRLPTIKELYSLIDFNGTDPSRDRGDPKPFLDTRYFRFSYGKEGSGDRIIDSQFATATLYTSTTMGGNKTMFGVNFADGRIKGYPAEALGPRSAKKYYVLYVRGNPRYGKNRFVRNGKTVTDQATGLVWAREDSGKSMNWKEALAWIQRLNRTKYLGYADWRLPDAKELQSLVDYSRSPKHTKSAAIAPFFHCSRITNEAGGDDYPYYWTSTTHISSDGSGSRAVYIAFGEAPGFFSPGREGGFGKPGHHKRSPEY